MLMRFRDFFFNKIWKKNLNKKTKIKRSFYYKIIKIFWISIYNFFKHHLILRASALTYFSLMAIVPFFALIFAVAKKIGYQEIIEIELIERFKDQKEIIDKIMEFAKNLIIEAKGGIIALVGIIFLFWSLIRVFSNLEISLNEIWNVKKFRNFKRRLSNYLALMFVIPISLVIFIAMKIYVLTIFSKELLALDFFKIIMNILPYLLILALFTFIYIFMPKIKVKFKYAFFSAIVSSLIYQLMQTIYVNFQVGITRLNAIYGSFAALPLFLIWLQFSWIIFLFGAELSYSFQNIDKIRIRDLKNK